jgi:hypothetical protein
MKMRKTRWNSRAPREYALGKTGSTFSTKVAPLPQLLGTEGGLTAKLFSTAQKERNFSVSLVFYLFLSIKQQRLIAMVGSCSHTIHRSRRWSTLC